MYYKIKKTYNLAVNIKDLHNNHHELKSGN